MAVKKSAARKPKAKRMTKKEVPCQRMLPQRLSGGGTDYMIPVDRNLSNFNHRLYEQGRNYSTRVHVPIYSGLACKVYALADTWFTHAAVRFARENYLSATKIDRDSLESQQLARWADFRVDSGLPINNSRGSHLSNVGITDVDVPLGEYLFSEVEDAGGLMKRFTITTPGPNDYNIMTEYSQTFNAGQDPSDPTTLTAYGDLPNMVKSLQQITDLQTTGDLPPYDKTFLMDSNLWVLVDSLDPSGPSNAMGHISTKFFNAPLGMVRCVFSGIPSETGVNLILECQKGDYKGVKADIL